MGGGRWEVGNSNKKEKLKKLLMVEVMVKF